MQVDCLFSLNFFTKSFNRANFMFIESFNLDLYL